MRPFIKKLKELLFGRPPLEEAVVERKKLDTRLDNLTKATIDGEEKWFLQMVRKDPDCALRVIRECDLDTGNDHD